MIYVLKTNLQVKLNSVLRQQIKKAFWYSDDDNFYFLLTFRIKHDLIDQVKEDILIRDWTKLVGPIWFS